MLIFVSWFVSCILLVVINSPKFDLISIPNLTQGIRVEDVLVVVLFVLLILHSRNIFAPKIIVCICCYLLFSSFLGVAFHPGINTFRFAYIARVLEYTVFAISIYGLRDKINFIFVCKVTLLIQIFSILFQICVGVGRPSGTFNGPWELVTVIGILMLFYSDHFRCCKKLPNGSATTILVSFLTKSRSATFGIFFTVLALNKTVRKYFPLLLLLIIPLAVFVHSVYDVSWLASALKKENFHAVKSFYEYAITGVNLRQELHDNFSTSADLSLVVRLGIWLNLVDLYLSSEWLFLKVFFGIGLGSNGIVVDGFYVRLLLELGFVGVGLYLAIMINLWKDERMKKIVTFLFFTCLTLDPYTSSKVAYTMGLLYAVRNRTV